MSAKAEPKAAEAKTDPKAPVEPKKDLGPPKLRKYGPNEYPEDTFVKVTYLATGGINGEQFKKGKTGSVPKAVFDSYFKPKKLAALYVAPKPKAIAKRPATDVGAFRRR